MNSHPQNDTMFQAPANLLYKAEYMHNNLLVFPSEKIKNAFVEALTHAFSFYEGTFFEAIPDNVNADPSRSLQLTEMGNFVIGLLDQKAPIQDIMEGEFYLKIIRADEYDYWRSQFIEGVTRTPDQQKKFPIRPGEKKHWTVTGTGIHERDSKSKQYTPEEKASFSQIQSFSLATIDVQPSPFGIVAGRSILVGVIIHPKDILDSNRLFIYDGGTIGRPYDFERFTDAERYFHHKVYVEGIFRDNTVPLLFSKNNKKAFKQALIQQKELKAASNQPYYNEVMARAKWNTDGSSLIAIATDDLTSRMLAQDRARVLRNRLEEQAKENGTTLDENYQVDICFYLPGDPRHLTRYTILEQLEDRAKALADLDNINAYYALSETSHLFKAVTASGHSLIYTLCAKGFGPAVISLLEKADKKTCQEFEMETSGIKLISLENAIKENNIEQLKWYIAHNADLSFANSAGATAVTLAAESGNLDVLKFLIEHHKPLKEGVLQSAFVAGVIKRHNAICEYLLALPKDLDPNKQINPLKRVDFAPSPLAVVCTQSNRPLIEIIFQHIEITQIQDIRDCLNIIYVTGNLDLLKLFITRFPQLREALRTEEELMKVVENTVKSDIINYLYENDPDIWTKPSLLIFSMNIRNSELAKILLDKNTYDQGAILAAFNKLGENKFILMVEHLTDMLLNYIGKKFVMPERDRLLSNIMKEVLLKDYRVIFSQCLSRLNTSTLEESFYETALNDKHVVNIKNLHRKLSTFQKKEEIKKLFNKFAMTAFKDPAGREQLLQHLICECSVRSASTAKQHFQSFTNLLKLSISTSNYNLFTLIKQYFIGNFKKLVDKSLVDLAIAHKNARVLEDLLNSNDYGIVISKQEISTYLRQALNLNDAPVVQTLLAKYDSQNPSIDDFYLAIDTPNPSQAHLELFKYFDSSIFSSKTHYLASLNRALEKKNHIIAEYILKELYPDTPSLIVAMKTDNIALVNLLAPHAELVTDSVESSPLYYAVHHSAGTFLESIVNAFCVRYQNDPAFLTSYLSILLLDVIQNKNSNNAILLLEKFRAHILLDYQNELGLTALMAAVMANDINCVQALLSNGANLEVKNEISNNATAFDYATTNEMRSLLNTFKDEQMDSQSQANSKKREKMEANDEVEDEEEQDLKRQRKM